MDGQQRVPHSETELEEFFDLSIDLLCIVGFDGYFKRVNASLERALGYPRRSSSRGRSSTSLIRTTCRASRDAMAQLGEGTISSGSSRASSAPTARCAGSSGTRGDAGAGRRVRRRARHDRAPALDAELREAQRMLEASRDELRVLADEQAALRRVATLVARESAPRTRCSPRWDARSARCSAWTPRTWAATTRMGRSSASRSGAATRASRSGRAFRSRATASRRGCCRLGARPAWTATRRPGRHRGPVREIGIRYSIGVPVSVEGRPWGVMIATSKSEEPFPAETESRLAGLHRARRDRDLERPGAPKLQALADEQPALRRVATLIARARFADRYLRRDRRGDRAAVRRSTRSRCCATRTTAPRVAARGAPARSTPIGARRRSEVTIAGALLDTGRAARLDDYDGQAPARARRDAPGSARPAGRRSRSRDVSGA